MQLSRPVYSAQPGWRAPQWLELSVPGGELEDFPAPEAALCNIK
jgi:hypothetical protein